MNDSREALLYSKLNEIQNSDKSPTWYNQRMEDPIYERLDRIIANMEWQQRFEDASTKNLDYYGSDHSPILCTIKQSTKEVRKKGRGRFQFEEKWLLEQHFTSDFLCEWRSFSTKDNTRHKLAKSGEFLKKWGKERNNIKLKELDHLREKRQGMMKNNDEGYNQQEFVAINRAFEAAEEAEACHWKQRARMNWLGHEDRNSKVFHAQATARRKKNTIKGLEDANGMKHSKEEKKAEIIREFFQELFTTSKPKEHEIKQVIEAVETMLMQEDFEFLNRP